MDRMSHTQGLINLLGKLDDPDPDIRYMSLNDLLSQLSHPGSNYLSHDPSTGGKLVDGLLKALSDQHGEVQNQALKCVGPLTSRLPLDSVTVLVDKLATLTGSPNIDTSVPYTALRTVIASLPRPVPGSPPTTDVNAAYAGLSKVLIPSMVDGSGKRSMLRSDPTRGFSSDAMDVLIEVVNCFGSLLKESELSGLSSSVMSIIENDHAGTAVTKRGLIAISILLAHFSDDQLSSFVSGLIESFHSTHLTLSRRRHLIATIGALAKSAPTKFGPYLKTLAPFVLSAVSGQELDEMNDNRSDDGEQDPAEDELREAALVALEALLGSCTKEMQPYLMDSIDAALRYLKYDPNVAEMDDEEMGGTQDGGSDDGATEDPDEDNDFDDFEEEEGYSDIDDISWKVRRCSAKVLYTIVSTYNQATALDDATLYQKITPALITRFNRDREESVKLEVITTVIAVVRKTADENAPLSPTGFSESAGLSKNSRKRRRQDSSADQEFDLVTGSSAAAASAPELPSSPESVPQAELARLVPSIVQNLTKMWKKASVPLKQVSAVLLKSLALVRPGGLADYLQQIEDPIEDALKSTGLSGATTSTGATSVSAGSLQIETLGLLAAIAETHVSNALMPFLIALIPGVIGSVHDRNYKVASEALGSVEEIIKGLTPPRVTSNEQDLAPQLERLYGVVVDQVSATSADLEVRHRAIHVLGVLLARTYGPQGAKFLSPALRSKGLVILSDRLKNETTRLSAARAIDDVALFASSEADVTTAWIGEVSAELGAQLRKADRALRGSCLETLKSLTINQNTRSHYDNKSIQELGNNLLPLLNADDLHLLTPALIIFAKVVPGNSELLVNASLISALCTVVLAPLTGTVLKAFLLLIRVIGEQSAGASLMKSFLQDVGVNGDPSVVGKAIGTLLVYGGTQLGVGVKDFLGELHTAQDNQRKCLALAILGEVGLRMGQESSLTPDLFISNFESKSDKVRLSAAVALGNTGTSNVKTYLPVILEGLEKSSSSNYLLLHSLKEILQHPESVRPDVAPFATRLWEILLVVSDDEDNRAVGAECIGRLALIDPGSYVPLLQEYLLNKNPAVRGTVISAFRYTLADSSTAYNGVLQPLIIPMLTRMLSDGDLGNHRLALTTVNSAIHNKMDLVFPHLGQLLPAVVADTVIKPELIREVQMGPFKHKVDDGLELRKSAYETLYACLDYGFSKINTSEFFDRILAGVADEQDIRIICNLMTSKLITLSPEETQRRLDSLSEKYRAVLAFKPKDSAVKQEIEKAQEASLGVLKISRELDRAFPGAGASGEHPAWKSYMEWVRKDFGSYLRNIDVEG
ncbi:hypothetical protein FQN54_006341 [Arachnomyces sp. PD_36]|nr:hypothetical protein FQN54_006341 [Arachnomyces sp. PD_36]